MNGLLTVYASSPKRVPPVLEPIILQSSIFFTLIISKYYLKKNYKIQQILYALLVIVGIMISLMPLFIRLYNGEEDHEFQSGSYWGAILFFSTVPAVMMNVLQEQIFEEVRSFDIIYFLALESLFQVLFVAFCFWTDLIPGFGTSTSFSELYQNFADSLAYVFFNSKTSDSHCSFCMLFIGLFTLAYCGSYVYSSLLIKHASANFNAMVSSMVLPVSTSFWIIFPAINAWINGPSTKPTDLIWYLLTDSRQLK